MAISAERQAYLAWLNKAAPLTAMGDAFLGGSPGLPAPYIGFFNVTDPTFGAKGDSNPATDDSVAINAAIVAAQQSSGTNIGVFIPDPPPQASGAPGFYNCKNPLLLYPGTRIYGSGMRTTILQFTDCDGVVPVNTGVLTPDVMLGELQFLGNAATSSSATATAGVRCAGGNHWHLHNIVSQGFVDQFVFDASNTGNALHTAYNLESYNTAYPNPINGFPRYGIRLTGSSGTTQCVEVYGGTISGVLSSTSHSFAGDNSTVTFNLHPNSPLWAESGIKVYFQTAGGVAVKKSSAGGSPDYQLYDFTTGTNVLIPNGSTGSRSQNVNVVFAVAPPSGTTVLVMFNDPTMAVGIYADQANACSFNLSQIQGCVIGIDDVQGGNYYRINNMEIIDTCVQPNGVNSTVLIGHVNATVDGQYSSSTGTLTVGDQGAGWDWQEVAATSTTGTQTFTSGSATTIKVDGSSQGLLSFTQRTFLRREVQVEFTCGFTNTSGGYASAEFTLQVTYNDENSWETLGLFEVSHYCDTANTFYSTISQTFRDTVISQPVGNDQLKVLYRLQVALKAGTNVTIQASDGSETYRLRARNVNLQTA